MISHWQAILRLQTGSVQQCLGDPFAPELLLRWRGPCYVRKTSGQSATPGVLTDERSLPPPC